MQQQSCIDVCGGENSLEENASPLHFRIVRTVMGRVESATETTHNRKKVVFPTLPNYRNVHQFSRG